jgi:hypothetical protein
VEEIEERTEYVLGGRFATITTVADLEAEFERLKKPVTKGA